MEYSLTTGKWSRIVFLKVYLSLHEIVIYLIETKIQIALDSLSKCEY